MHPLALGAARAFLGHATNIQLHLTQAIAIGPGETAQPIHRDQWAFDFFPFPAGYEVQCNTIWALTDFTEENGATRVVVGSNAGRGPPVVRPRRHRARRDATGVGALLFGQRLPRGWRQHSAATRIGLNITYAVAWLRQEENQYLSVPREVAETLPVDLLRLMGYDRGAYALGYIDDLRDPIESVRPGIGTTGFAAHAARAGALHLPCVNDSDPVRASTVGVVPVDIRMATVDDYDELFVAFSRIVSRATASRSRRRSPGTTSTTTGSTTPPPSRWPGSAAI